MTNITQDSGIHTMSSRRESAFSDGALQYFNSTTNGCHRKANSDCMPVNTYLQNHCLGGSLDQLTNRLQNVNVQTYTRHDHSSVFSHVGSCCDHQKSCSCPHEPVRISHCSGRIHPSDPGGGSFTCQRFNNQSGCCSGSARNFHSGHTVENRQIKATVEKKTNGLEPLCAKRLLPTRHQTKNAILSILENREVCIEFIKKRGQPKKEMVCEVCRISPDGLRIILYEPEGGKGVPPSNTPPPLPSLGTDQIFSFESLPEKHWKKYSYAAKFVDLVRAKTPKVTYYTDKAKCLLMENLTDFEACFHEGGKVTQSVAEGVTLIDAAGCRLNLKSVSECSDLSATFELMWNHAQEGRNHCLLLESTLAQLPGENFPIIVGRRPNALGIVGKENQITTITVR